MITTQKGPGPSDDLSNPDGITGTLIMMTSFKFKFAKVTSTVTVGEARTVGLGFTASITGRPPVQSSRLRVGRGSDRGS